MAPVRLLHPDEIGEGLFPVGVPVIRARAVEAGVDQDGEVVDGWNGAAILSGTGSRDLKNSTNRGFVLLLFDSVAFG
jgi:hypothetical protein